MSTTTMMIRIHFSVLSLLLFLIENLHPGSCIKIAFVGDTGLEDESYYGYGHRTMRMIENQDVDLVINVGDFDYWGRCVESYYVTQTLNISSTVGRIITVPVNSTLQRYKWQDGRHGSTRGWEVGVEQQQQQQIVLDGLGNEMTFTSTDEQRVMIRPKMWNQLSRYLVETNNCWGEPWDGPWTWYQFLMDHNFAFLGSSGNAEVMDEGNDEIWAAHQQYMHKLYIDRIYNTNKGACHGYIDQQEPGSVQEYGERYSCFYKHGVNGHEDFHFVFLGWWQGSDEHWNDESKKERQQSIEFIEREFSSPRSQQVRWRFCIHHLTSAKLSAGDDERDSMELSGLTDTCRRYGALIINGHHHLYSRTKLLQNVGGPDGTENVTVANSPNSSEAIKNGDSSTAKSTISAFVVSEGVTMSITVGMGGYDSSCDGKYVNASWMELCVASLEGHRGAVIAEFGEATPWTGTFQYLNSMAEAEVVDEFMLTSRLPGWNITPDDQTTLPITQDDQTTLQDKPVQGKPPMSSQPSPPPLATSTSSSDAIRRWAVRDLCWGVGLAIALFYVY